MADNYYLVKKEIANKYKDVKLIITTDDGEYICETLRIVISSYSEFFEKFFEKHIPIEYDKGVSIYKLSLPFSKNAVTLVMNSFQVIDQKIPITDSLEYILALNYIQIPSEMIDMMISSIVRTCEDNNCHQQSKQLMTDLYVLIDEFSIFSKSKTHNLRKRIEYMTEFITDESVTFLKQPKFSENRFIVTEYLCDTTQYKVTKEFNYRDMIFTIENSYESSQDREATYFIGISSRPLDENSTLTIDESIKSRANRKSETKHPARICISIHYGLKDCQVLEVVHHKTAFISGKETSCLPEFPPEMGLGLCSRSWYGGLYNHQKNNQMAFALIDVEFL